MVGAVLGAEHFLQTGGLQNLCMVYKATKSTNLLSNSSIFDMSASLSPSAAITH